MPQILETPPARTAASRHVLDQVLTVVALAETCKRDESS